MLSYCGESKMSTMYRFSCGCSWPVVGPAPREGALPLMDVDDDNLPFCPLTWDLLGRGDTKGVFQLESNLGRQWTKKLKPESGEHMGALGALLRPGCLRAVDDEGVSMTQHFCRRKNNEEEVKPYHEVLDMVLSPTFGCLVYQEQAMLLAQNLAAFNLQEADQLRKAIGKKLPEEMAKCKKLFTEGAKKAGLLTEAQAEEVFGWIEQSQRYSFNKSHAVSYGLTGYDTAYIKAHFPVAFYCSWLRFAREKQDPMQEVYELVNDSKLNDVQILPPDLRNMEPHFATDGVVVTFGLSNIKGVGINQISKTQNIIREVEQEIKRPLAKWKWLDFLFFCSHRMTSSTVIKLARVNALRWFNMSRQRMEAEFETWDDLTDAERNWIINHERLGRGLIPPEALGSELPPEPLLSDARYQGMDAKIKEKKLKIDRKAWEKKVREREEYIDSLRGQKPFTSLVEALRAVARPKKDGGGAMPRRIDMVMGMADLLENPGSENGHIDKPDWIAWTEEENLGIALTCSRVDGFNQQDVNTSCKDFINGKTGYMIFGVEIEEVREVKTKNGKNPGQRMAFITMADGSCSLSDVICFPEAWKQYSGLFKKGNCVIIQAERDPKQNSLIVKRACQMER
jgi:DNA polymerase III alpha subunit